MTLINRNFFERYHIDAADKIVVGVSGWVDSMVLLENILSLHAKSGVVAVHVDHSLRWEESDEDSAFVRDHCEKLGITCEITKIDLVSIALATKQSLETAGRLERKRVFEEMREKHGAKYVFLAHHMDDSVETVLFNLFRGSRLRGVSGIREHNGIFLRPFLSVTKSEIRKYAEGKNIPFREDSSNSDEKYLRNKIRASIVPEIEKINPNFRKNILDFSSFATRIQEHFESQIVKFLIKGSISVSEYANLDELLQTTFIECIYRQANGTSVGLSQGNIAEIDRFITSARGNTSKKIKNLALTKKNQSIAFAKAE